MKKKIYNAPVVSIIITEPCGFICGSGSNPPDTSRQSDLDGISTSVDDDSGFTKDNGNGRGSSGSGNRSKDNSWSVWDD